MSLSVPASAAETVETVVVTGSRIPQQGLYSSSPVTAVGQQEMKFEGTTNVESLLNNLPSAFADFTDTASNGATGQATVNLRNLGAARTLVLIDGSRLMPSNPANPVADLNQVPASLVDHVEVQTGGASAVYGSDAEAGVVNFIMRRNFQGVEFDGQYSIDQAGNGNQFYRNLNTTAGFPNSPKNWWGGGVGDATLIIDTNTANDKGNVTLYLNYRNTQPVLEGKRDFSSCSISVVKVNKHACAGSSNYNRWISIDDYSAGQPYDFFENGTGAAGSGTFATYTGATTQKFNYGALNYLQRPDTRYSGGFFGHYEVTPAADVYADFMFSDDHTLAQIAPSGLFLGTGAQAGYVNVNCDNPLMTGQENDRLCGPTANGGPGGATAFVADARYGINPGTGLNGYYNGGGNITPGQSFLEIGRRNIEGGNRIDDLRHTAYRLKIGLKGDLGNSWNYVIYAQYGTTLYSENYQNELSVQRVQNALQVTFVGTTPTCTVVSTNIDKACVPLDIFNGFGSISNGALGYVAAQGFKEGFTEEQVVSGSLTGDLGQYGVQSPWSKSPVSVAVGAEYRAEYIGLQTSRDFQTGDLYGSGGKTLPIPKSGFSVTDGFGEIRIPVIQDMPFAEELSVNGAYRYSDFSSGKTTTAWELSAKWQPIDDIAIRGSKQTAVRAANVLELFSPLNKVLFGGQDPCATPANATVLANCVANGAPNAGSGILKCPASQCKAQVGGTLTLTPETSDTKEIGIVLTPTFFEGFTATVDYFDIKVANSIGTVNPNVTLAACYGALATAISQAAACPLVGPNRNPITHAISGEGYVSARTVNNGGLHTSGVDFEANYQKDLGDWGMTGDGSLALAFVGTYLKSLVVQPITGYVAYDCAGLFGPTCGTPSPQWRHKMRATWTTPWDVDVSLQWRHLSGVSLDLNNTNPLLHGLCGASGTTCPELADGKIGAHDYFDLSTSWNVREGIELRFGVDNILDKDPPVLDSNTLAISSPPFGNGNTYPGVYDSLGRTIFVGATIKY